MYIIIAAIVAAFVLWLAFSVGPDIYRYLRMRNM